MLTTGLNNKVEAGTWLQDVDEGFCEGRTACRVMRVEVYIKEGVLAGQPGGQTDTTGV